MAETNYRINDTTKILMMGTAIAIDISEFILAFFAIGLIANRVIVAIKVPSFWLWFWFYGITPLKLDGKHGTKRLKKWGWYSLWEMIPIVGTMPWFSYNVYKNIASTREEDEEKAGTQTQIVRTFSKAKQGLMARKLKEAKT